MKIIRDSISKIKEFLGTNYEEEDENYSDEINNYDWVDPYFVEAGRIVVDKDRTSIGMLQRYLKIEFSDAARIMDQLEYVGVVGPAEGTKPRQVLMNSQEFDSIAKNIKISEPKTILYEDNTISQTNYNLEDPLDKKIEDMLGRHLLRYELGIDVDYSEDGLRIRDLKNILVPSATNDEQTEVINMLLKYNSPETMKLLLIDLSVINYCNYNGIPHLMFPVMTDELKIGGVFGWLSAEMNDRIRKFLKINVRNIDDYNKKIVGLKSVENIHMLPRVICIINEATTLSRDLDDELTKLFLNCNTVGIHFILFSRFKTKSIPLGNKMELLEIMNSKTLLSMLEKEKDKQNITRKNYDNMDGFEFEQYCAEILKKNGFDNVEVTQGSGDHGVDVLAEKDGITYAIQCKCYSSSIGNSAIQQAHSGKSIYKRDIAVVMTNQYFTPQAIEEAAQIGVKLWDRDKLNKMIK
jgi:HJR/Mrr/RecB family endonuclease